MTNTIYRLFFILSLLTGSGAVAEQPSEVLIQGHIKVEDDEVVFRFTCEESADCKVAMGDFESTLRPGLNIVFFQIAKSTGKLQFIDEHGHAIIQYGKDVKTFSIFDAADDDFVRNGANTPVGYLKLSATRVE
ncbi:MULTISPECIES: hypothetical protein [unclassified Ruegeria]|uniref:hypothetical protein n=1 Tax=unclassified Ruegeria TaxID=2625375 RepID=UPI00148835AE|nr:MULTISPECIES: hypothetical protein [unclassified Ruegeria]NOD48649.1 hypothetical protein [Ruegeria sp. HKCCD5849]NOD52049.1 hypothetical protein [Ruegeria sp. HKCCD5851]NOD66707.1 hypothetical protein [Ruegeria sp. HKCCD7303]NOE33811.1 hypothetical protein [Ruegeria sp. HKCCD7318]